MPRQISEDETEKLFAFVQKKSVRQYDVQLELVDHLASGIETEWEQAPAMSFDDALKKVYARFGLFGFTEFVREKNASAAKFIRRTRWSIFKSFFMWPRIWVTITSILAILQLARIVPLQALFLLVFVIDFGFTFSKLRLIRPYKHLQPKLLLLQNFSNSIVSYWIFFISDLEKWQVIQNPWKLTLGILIILGLLSRALIDFETNKLMLERAKKEYPHLFASK